MNRVLSIVHDHQEGIKQTIDGTSVVVMVGAFVEMLPAIAAGFTIIWTVIRIYETKTVQRCIKKLMHGKDK